VCITYSRTLNTHVYVWCSGAGTNLKVGGGAGKFIVVRLHFLALKVQLVVLVSAFVMVSTVTTVSCLLSFYSRCLPCPAICKSWGTCPSCMPYGVGVGGCGVWLESSAL